MIAVRETDATIALPPIDPATSTSLALTCP